MESFFVVVAGGRDFNDYKLLESKLDFFLSTKSKTHNIVIVSGTCKGADLLGERYALRRGYQVLRFPPDWQTYYRSAAVKRNEEMAKAANAVVVFWDNYSHGTKNMIDNAKKYNLPLKIVYY